MSLRVQYDEAGDLYELVDDVEGVPVAFAAVEGDRVRSRVENAKASQLVTPAKQAGQTEGGTATTTTEGGGLVSNAATGAQGGTATTEAQPGEQVQA